MYVGSDFPDAAPSDSRPYGFDFGNDIDATEIIASSSWTCAVKADSSLPDPSPQSHVTGSPVNSGQIASQRIAGLLDGVFYVITCVATTNAGNEVTLHSHVECHAPA